MAKYSRATVSAFATCCLGVVIYMGCNGESSLFDLSRGASSGSSGDGGDEDASASNSRRLFGTPFGAEDDGGSSCVNLQCKQVACSGTTTTTITGTVFDPAGKNPLYNALVYIPNAPVAPFDDDAGVTCDKCGGAFASGKPIVVDITAPDGSFTLKNVPVGVELPLVIQIGKWRRVVTIPAATACTNNPITDVGLTRMPRNSQEGHLPRMAIATGGADPFECLLRKIGIDDGEFTLPTHNGRIHYYKAHGGRDLGDAGGPTPATSTLWTAPETLPKYDVVLFPCEATPDNSAKAAENKQTDAGYANVESYLNLGGRAFFTHYSYTWLIPPALFPTVANWVLNEADRSDVSGVNPTLQGTIDTSFPKGQAFSQWLGYVDASTDAGTLPINDWRHDLSTENKPPSQRWVHADTHSAWSNQANANAAGAGPAVQHFTFNTPVDAGVDDAGDPLQCGKVVFSDFHVSAGERKSGNFPDECRNNPMSPQEKALEFMLFDLSACIQKEDEAPTIPPDLTK